LKGRGIRNLAKHRAGLLDRSSGARKYMCHAYHIAAVPHQCVRFGEDSSAAISNVSYWGR
jgi:hypothetical protein